jgi:alpha-1,6-mannosyltransferase
VVGIRGSYMDRIIHSDQAHWAAQNTPRALAQAIVEAAMQDLAAVGEAVSLRVALQYSWETVFIRLFEIYRDTIRSYRN